MHRKPILSLFDQYQARFPNEAETVNQIRSFVEQHENCFDRELLVGHITGSAWIVDSTATKALLTHHKKLNIWVQLGGHADGDSNVQRVAEKEANEESGIDALKLVSPEIFDIDIHAIPARKSEPEHFHYDCRFLLQAASEAFVVSDESHDLKWIPLQEMTDYTNEMSVLRMVEKTESWRSA